MNAVATHLVFVFNMDSIAGKVLVSPYDPTSMAVIQITLHLPFSCLIKLVFLLPFSTLTYHAGTVLLPCC